MPHARTLFRRHVALPSDHGSWAFLIAPLLLGVLAGGRIRAATVDLVVAALAGFLARQPLTMLVKIGSGRRGRQDLPAAAFWTAIYGLVAAGFVAGLVVRGYRDLLWLAIPGGLAFAWHLALVARREERRRMAVEILGTGALALAAPAAMWVGLGRYDPRGLWLWGVLWLQAAASIVYVYLRLEQRRLAEAPSAGARLAMGRPAIAANIGALAAVAALAAAGVLPSLLWLPFAVPAIESVRGTLAPAVKMRPAALGWRQVVVTAAFVALFAVTWRG